MAAYVIGILLMIQILKESYPGVTQPWYDDDVGALVTYKNIELYFNSLKQFGPGHGYYTKPSKNVLIVHRYNIESGKKLTCLTGLRFAVAHIISAFLSGVMSPNVIFL